MLRPFGGWVITHATITLRYAQMRPKGPLPADRNVSVIFRFPCAESLLRRNIQDDRNAMGRLDNKSLVFAHAANTYHNFRYDDAEVISLDARKGG